MVGGDRARTFGMLRASLEHNTLFWQLKVACVIRGEGQSGFEQDVGV